MKTRERLYNDGSVLGTEEYDQLTSFNLRFKRQRKVMLCYLEIIKSFLTILYFIVILGTGTYSYGGKSS